METEGDVSQDWGSLLFDESQTGLYKKRKWRDLASTILYMMLGVFVLSISTVWALAGYWPLTVVFGSVTIVIFYIEYCDYKDAKSTGPIRVFERGLALGRSVWFMKKEERDFIPFENLERVYVNGCFAYRPKGEDRAPWFQFDTQFDTEAFLRSLEGRVEVETDAHIGLDHRITWRIPDAVHTDDLHIDLAWGDKSKRLMFDDISRFMSYKGVVILTMRSGDIYQVEMKWRMYGRFCKSWNEYVNRFWENPEDEVERWKRMEVTHSDIQEK